jgi:4'-phosphopantetheinyl transferase
MPVLRLDADPVWTSPAPTGDDTRMPAAQSGNTDVRNPRPVRVWRAALDRPDEETATLRALLSDDEQARADRFRFPHHRKHFIVGRGFLRTVLGSTLGIAPQEIAFSYGTRGKPALRWPERSGLEFNLAHSNGQALLATAGGRALGIDLEYQREELDFLGIAGRFFTPQELAEIQRAPGLAAQRAAFFRGWARKEAFLKARGDGLWIGLDQFQVAIDPATPPRVVHTAWDPDEADRWTLRDLDAPPGFAAALVVAGSLSEPIDVDSF